MVKLCSLPNTYDSWAPKRWASVKHFATALVVGNLASMTAIRPSYGLTTFTKWSAIETHSRGKERKSWNEKFATGCIAHWNGCAEFKLIHCHHRLAFLLVLLHDPVVMGQSQTKAAPRTKIKWLSAIKRCWRVFGKETMRTCDSRKRVSIDSRHCGHWEPQQLGI